MHLRAFATAVVMACALTGCADAGVMGGRAEPGGDATSEFSPRRVDQALLTADDLGGPFRLADDEDHEFDSGVDSYDARFGCLTALDVLDNKANDPADAAHEFDTGTEDAVANVLTAVISYRSVDVAEKAMDDLDRELTRCKPVDYTEPDDGTRWEMDPQADTEVRAKGGDRQTTVTGVGIFSGGDVVQHRVARGGRHRRPGRAQCRGRGDGRPHRRPRGLPGRGDPGRRGPAGRGHRARGSALTREGPRRLRPGWRRSRRLSNTRLISKGPAGRESPPAGPRSAERQRTAAAAATTSTRP